MTLLDTDLLGCMSYVAGVTSAGWPVSIVGPQIQQRSPSSPLRCVDRATVSGSLLNESRHRLALHMPLENPLFLCHDHTWIVVPGGRTLSAIRECSTAGVPDDHREQDANAYPTGHCGGAIGELHPVDLRCYHR